MRHLLNPRAPLALFLLVAAAGCGDDVGAAVDGGAGDGPAGAGGAGGAGGVGGSGGSSGAGGAGGVGGMGGTGGAAGAVGGPAHYVRQGASGNGDDWSSAYGALPASLTRGHVYYVAAGQYPSYAATTPNSGAAAITIKAATGSDHGTEMGWSSSYAGTATFAAPFKIKSDHWLLDGSTRASPSSGHGIKIDNATASAGSGGVLMLGDPFDGVFPGVVVHDVTVRFVEVAGSHAIDCTKRDESVYVNQDVTDVTLSYLYAHDSEDTTPLSLHGGSNIVLEHSLGARNLPCSGQHSSMVNDNGGASNVTIRFNVFEDGQSTALFDLHAAASGWKIYGNVMWSTPSFTNGYGNGVFTTLTGASCMNCTFVGNSIANLRGGASTRIFCEDGTSACPNMKVQNNIWFNCIDASHAGLPAGGADHNYYITTPFPAGEANAQSSPATDPFVGSQAGDFHLSRATEDGAHLSAPFDVDMDGRTRGVDGVWDRGAFEH